MSTSKRRVAYYYDDEVGNYTFGPNHVMKPQRMRMVHNLVVNYGMDKKMEVLRPNRATFLQMTQFHTDAYIDFLKTVSPENMKDLIPHQARYLSGDDCPVWDGIYEFCSISAGGSIAGAHKLNRGESDIAINWSGGLHHAKKSEASGFCYVNDIVLGILELLRCHQRVIYVDCDVHHGDGVEEAFYTTDRVMTISFHKYGDFFPGTGDLADVGLGSGKKYAVNVPLRDGIDDESYAFVFRSVMQNVMDFYQPGAILLQCGTDSLAGDRLGCFNLSMRGHAACVKFMRSFNVPMIVVGGGGYTIRNVARTWTYETSVCLGVEVDPNLPFHDYYEYYGPDYRLDVPSSNMENFNSRPFLERIRNNIADRLRSLPHAPSVQTREVPRDADFSDIDSEADEDAATSDIRISQRQRDTRVNPDNEFADLAEPDDSAGEWFKYDRSFGYQPARDPGWAGRSGCYFGGGEDLEPPLPPSVSQENGASRASSAATPGAPPPAEVIPGASRSDPPMDVPNPRPTGRDPNAPAPAAPNGTSYPRPPPPSTGPSTYYPPGPTDYRPPPPSAPTGLTGPGTDPEYLAHGDRGGDGRPLYYRPAEAPTYSSLTAPKGTYVQYNYPSGPSSAGYSDEPQPSGGYSGKNGWAHDYAP